MAVLYKNSNIYVSTEFIEFKGVRYNPEDVVRYNISKTNEEYKTVAICATLVLFGIYWMISWKWKFLGGAIFGFGAYFLYYNVNNIIQKKVLTFLSLTFKTTYTGDAQVEILDFYDYNEAEKCLDAIIKSKK